MYSKIIILWVAIFDYVLATLPMLTDLRSKLTCRVLMIDLTALYFFNNLYIVLDITSLSSATCFDVISERNKNQISDRYIMGKKSNNKLLEIFFINISHQVKDTRDEASLITLLICSRIILFHSDVTLTPPNNRGHWILNHL